MQLRAKARLSQLDLANIGKADINCDIKGRNLSLEYPKDSASALLPVLDVNLATKGNTIDRNLKQGARVLALKALIDTLDVTYGSTFVRGGKLNLLMQNSADVLKGRTDRSSIMGLLRVNNLRMRDSDGRWGFGTILSASVWNRPPRPAPFPGSTWALRAVLSA